MNSDERRDLLSLAGCGRPSEFETTRGGCGLSAAEYDRVYERLGAFDGDRTAAAKAIESLDSDDRKRVYERLARIDSTRAQSVLHGINEVDNGASLAARIYQKRANGVTTVSRPAELFSDLRQLRESDVDIDDEVMHKLTADNVNWGNRKGSAYEIEVAAKYQRNGNNVVAVGYDPSGYNSDADVVVRETDGDIVVVEAKNDNPNPNEESVGQVVGGFKQKLRAAETHSWSEGRFDKMIIEIQDENNYRDAVIERLRQLENVEVGD